MPILIRLKDPQINLIVDDEIKDTMEANKEWDALFSNGVLITKSMKGNNILVPLWTECNIAFMQNVTKKDIEEQQKKAEEEAKKRGGPGPRGNIIDTPGFLFPSGGSHRKQ